MAKVNFSSLGKINTYRTSFTRNSASTFQLKFSILKCTYLQRYRLAVNDVFVGADGGNETIHFTETVIVADLAIL